MALFSWSPSASWAETTSSRAFSSRPTLHGLPTVAQAAELSEGVRAFSLWSSDALFVVEPRGDKRVGLVTRASLAEVLLE
jgi:hypothetical protein